MKFIFQIILFCLLILISFIFYNKYFLDKKNVKGNKTTELVIQSDEKKDEIINPEKQIENNQENLIKNFKYNVELAESGKYEIKSDLSELVIQNGEEIIFMKDVTAIFTDNKNRKILINSDSAEFNSITYNTYFNGNIKIRYDTHFIKSDKLTFNFKENNILVHQNVVYSSLDGKIETDNIKINLLSKNIKIFMNNKNNNVKIITF